MRIHPFVVLLVLLSLAALGAAVVLVSTSAGALAVSPDSVSYVAAAVNLAAGNGFLGYEGFPYTSWPPLYPVLIAVGNAVGQVFTVTTPLETLRFVHSGLYMAVVFFSSLLVLISTNSRSLAVIAALAVTFSFPLLRAAVFVWSELLFVLLMVLFTLFLARLLHKPRVRLLIIAAVLAGLAVLQRYMGVAVIAAGGVSILFFAQTGLKQRLRLALVFGLVSSVPIAAWVVRNLTLSDQATGPRPASAITLWDAGTNAMNTILDWFAPHGLQEFSAAVAGVMFILLLCMIPMLIHRYRWHQKQSPGDRLDQITLAQTGVYVSVIVYIMALVTAHSTTSLHVLWHRDMVPIYPLVICLVLICVDAATRWLARVYGIDRALLQVLAVSALTAWFLLYPLPKTLREMNEFRSFCCDPVWTRLELIETLRTLKPDTLSFSNTPLPLYAGIVVIEAPHVLDAWGSMPGEHDDQRLAWFSDLHEGECSPDNRCYRQNYTLDELSTAFDVASLYQYPEGGIYLVRRQSDLP